MTSALEKPAAPATSLEVRKRIVEALRLDLVGPWAGHELASEQLGWERPSAWYVTGILVPADLPLKASGDADEEEEIDHVDESTGLPEESSEERKSAKKSFFPSSMGLSFFVAAEAKRLTVTVRWGDYELTTIERDEEESLRIWVRQPRHEEIRIYLADLDSAPIPVPSSDGLLLQVVQHVIPSDALVSASGNTRSVSVFLINKRPVPEKERDSSYAFQTEIEVQGDCPFEGQPDPRGLLAEDSDEQIADLHYADTPYYATGHGVSADWEVKDGECRLLRTTWIPSADVERTESVQLQDVELSMEALGALEDGEACRATLQPLVDRYVRWISERAAESHGTSAEHHHTAAELLRRARRAADRIKSGIEELATNPSALDAFKVANRAVAHALRRRLSAAAEEWRAFQLAFILQSIPGLSDPRKEVDRETVDLLFFPTGGGKTEAYLGLAAFTMVLRRLQFIAHNGRQGAGVCVIMRYTLRLLTFDQLSRAAGLVCALELEREKNVSKYGDWPFEIGIWVGSAATPNRMGKKGDGRPNTARDRTLKFQGNPSSSPSPIPLENCPWCGERFGENSFVLMPDTDHPTDLRIYCHNFECDFNGDRSLPIVAVDEPIYRRLPAFLIATVDKFASLPWEGASGALLGGATHFDDKGFYGPADRLGGNRKLVEPLLGPDLVIQDELHLISGPLGTMAGLYETAIEALCLRGRRVRPKIVASTATIRRATDQIQALFARPQTEVFPPHGPDRRDSFFARIERPTEVLPARLYIGITAQGRSSKALLRRTVLALMGAAQKLWWDSGGSKNGGNPADPYMSMLGYFNSLKELGGARRVLEEEVRNTLAGYGRRRRFGESIGLFRDRVMFRDVVELTSRVPTNQVATARRRLGNGFHQDNPVDCAIATNMISVGLDIPRLGLMVVNGQPKTTSEYIQATSRVGRDPKKPGLVIDILNVHRHRDRSHFEHFRHYHETFYRSVEIASVTPFSARALDRGFAGALVALARHGHPTMTRAEGVERIAENRVSLERQTSHAFLDRVQNQPYPDEEERKERMQSVRYRVADLLESWSNIVSGYTRDGVGVQYQQYERYDSTRKHLLQSMLAGDLGSEDLYKFRANRSLRDVETEVHLNLRQLGKGPGGSALSARKVHGALRSSQVITTYGPGALIDLPKHAAVVGGLETWPSTGKLQSINEPRLEAKIHGITKVKFPKLFCPPGEPTEFWRPRPMIGAYRFPEWFVVQERTPRRSGSGPKQDGALREGSRRLVPRSALDERDRFDGCQVVPTRFVRACPLGHVDDLDWRGFVHQGKPCTRQLWLDERGTTGDLGQLVVRCECGMQRRLYEAVDTGFGPCRGTRPWLGPNAAEHCDKQSTLLTRTATNAYFPQVVSVLSLPDRHSELDSVIDRHWDFCQLVKDEASLKVIRGKPEIDQALPRGDNQAILQAIARRRSGKTDALPVKQAELAALLASEEGFGEDVPVNPRFHARKLPDSAWRIQNEFEKVASVVQLHRLLEVLALVGFTRLEPETPDIHGEFDTDVTRAAISTSADWFPAVENRGEGIFIQLRSESIHEWVNESGVKERIDQLRAGHAMWKRTRKPNRLFPGGPYVLLHTLSHMLIQSLATNCGYPASAIRERIYAEPEGYGILLYTGSPDADGTLGGLVQQARHITDHLRYAIRTGSLCSNDPICAQHTPVERNQGGSHGRELHGAACHGCTLISETSCEMRNEFLDRALVVPVLGLENVAFFGRTS